MAAVVSHAKSYMIPSRVEVKRKHKFLHLLYCRPEGACEVKFATWDHFLVSQTETSLSSLGSREESGCEVEASCPQVKKSDAIFFLCRKKS